MNIPAPVAGAPRATCVGIILDGNRRWAKERELPKLEGHRAGMETLKTAARFIRDSGVAHLVVYAFSTENWNRDVSEVSYLMDLFRETIQKELKELGREGIRVRFVGQRERFSADLQRAMDDTEKETRHNDSFTLWVCLSYGGRSEIAAAARVAAAEGEITEESLARHLWTAEMPDPDIIIRTSGEKRLSGFLPWQSVYSELFFTDTKWPAFTKEEFDSILAEFAQRERRRGK
ncbi:di-trans,poly-cis-decaprenylcistransferase [Candidatus Kaiserbacteria bacterium]|nr:di-trans,poly-cis-decaprenylcistransferase [Candidatus Kaiserbacteria bacterium]